MSVLSDFVTARDKLYEHVGFKEDWVVYAINEHPDSRWRIVDSEIQWAATIQELEDGDGEFYSAKIYTQRFYNKHIYRGSEFTLVFGDPGVDGCRWLYVFDNKKEWS